MYWPNGVPRVYAVNGPAIPLPSPDERPATGRESPQEHKSLVGNDYVAEEQSSSSNANVNNDDGQWAQEPIGGLCASRTGHMFATMTKSSIAIWQTKVCEFIRKDVDGGDDCAVTLTLVFLFFI